MRLFKRSAAKRAKGPYRAAQRASGVTYAYAVDPFGRNEDSTPSAVIIDGFPYTLQGEPPTARCGTTGFKGNGQR
jgi:hypothetical protein